MNKRTLWWSTCGLSLNLNTNVSTIHEVRRMKRWDVTFRKGGASLLVSDPPVPLRVLKHQNVGAEILTLNLQVLLSLEVFDRGMIHDADDRNAVILPADGEGQPAGHGVHLIIGQLNSGFPCEQAEAHGWQSEERKT